MTYDYIKPLLKKCSDNIILHVGTNSTVTESSKVVLGKLFDLKKFIENTLPESNVIISDLITRADNGKTSLTVSKTNEHLHGFQMDIIDNRNITSNQLNKAGLHLNPRGLGKLAINFIRRIKKFATTWWSTGIFHKASSFDFQTNFRSRTSLGNIKKSDQSARNRVNETSSEETLKNDVLNEIREKNPNSIITAHLNMNSIRNKFEMLREVRGNKINFLLISETKLDDTFPLSQFILEGFTPPYRLDRKEHGWGLMLFIREEILSKLLPNVNLSRNREYLCWSQFKI